MAAPTKPRPPANLPMVDPVSGAVPTAWVSYFDALTRYIDYSDARHDAHEARLLTSEARLLSIENRLTAAGIP
jgi:hypothetical protein